MAYDQETDFPVFTDTIHEPVTLMLNGRKFRQGWLSNHQPYGFNPGGVPDNHRTPQFVSGDAGAVARGNGHVIPAGRGDNPTVIGSDRAMYAAAWAGYLVGSDFDDEVNPHFQEGDPLDRLHWDWDERMATLYQMMLKSQADGPRGLTVTQAARQLGISPITVRAQIRRNRLVAIEYGNEYRILQSEIDRYRRENLGNVGRPS